MSNYINKEEDRLKHLFCAELKRQAPDFLVLHYLTNGAPDREVIGNGITSRWEFKHATPDFRSPGDQELMCVRLAEQGHCMYVVWIETAEGQNPMTLIVHPREVFGRKGKSKGMQYRTLCDGFDMKWLVTEVLKAHR